MPLNENDLEQLVQIATDFTYDLLQRKELTGKFDIDTILLYGSGARHFLGLTDKNRDFDLGIFLRKPGKNVGDIRTINIRGIPWDAGNYDNKKVEVLYNLLKPKHTDWKEYVLARRTGRWTIIRTTPILVLHPLRENLERLL